MKVKENKKPETPKVLKPGRNTFAVGVANVRDKYNITQDGRRIKLV